MSELSRLSDLNITDDILRGEYYRLVIAHINTAGNTELTEHTIKLDEAYRADLASYRVYGVADLEWLVCLVCSVQDVAEPLPVGETIKLPGAAWVRASMRQFLDDMGLTHA